MENGGRIMNRETFNDLSYGMYVITTKENTKNIGCFINTVNQITSSNPIVAVSLNKENYTNKILKESKKCAISILSEKTNPEVISTFGYFSSKDTDKFKNINYKEIDNLPVILENICGYMIGEVIKVIDAETHDIFLIRINKAEKIGEKIPMTYRYYHEKLKGKAPQKAPTYIEEQKENSTSNRYQCIICGYIYDDSKEEVKFEDLDENWKCPRCGVGKDKFIKI